MLTTDVIVTIEIRRQRVSEIHTLLDKLAASYQFGGQSSEWLLPLHSSIASTDQKKAVLRPPDNIRKVSLSALVLKILMSPCTCRFFSHVFSFFCILFYGGPF